MEVRTVGALIRFEPGDVRKDVQVRPLQPPPNNGERSLNSKAPVCDPGRCRCNPGRSPQMLSVAKLDKAPGFDPGDLQVQVLPGRPVFRPWLSVRAAAF